MKITVRTTIVLVAKSLRKHAGSDGRGQIRPEMGPFTSERLEQPDRARQSFGPCVPR